MELLQIKVSQSPSASYPITEGEKGVSILGTGGARRAHSTEGSSFLTRIM